MMKKIALLLAFIFTVSAGFSQQRKRMQHKADTMTPEQRTTLNVKRLTLALDLTKDQANKVASLYSKMSKTRMEKVQQVKKQAATSRAKLAKIKKESKDNEDFKKRVKVAAEKGELKKEDLRGLKRQRGRDFESANNALDNMIAHQNEMKKILTKEQFAKYKKMQKHRVTTAKSKRSKTAKRGKTEKREKMMKRKKMKRNR